MRSIFVATLLTVAVLAQNLDQLYCIYSSSYTNPNVTGWVRFDNPTSLAWSYGGLKLTNGATLQWHIHISNPDPVSALATADAHYNQTGNNIGELDMHYGLLNATQRSGSVTANPVWVMPTGLSSTVLALPGRSVVLYNGASTTPVACCNIGFYSAAPGVTRCQFLSIDTKVQGWINFVAGSINYNITALGADFPNGARMEVHEYSVQPSITSCGNTGNIYYSGNLTGPCGTLTLAQGIPATSSCATTIYNNAIANLTIAGRSVMVHDFYNATTAPRYGFCNIGYYNPTLLPTTAAPTTVAPTADTNNSSVLFFSVFILIISLIAALL